MAKDLFHYAVRAALEKEDWVITDDPLKLEVGGTKFEIDLGVEQMIGAERSGVKIAVEIKSFLGDSPLTDYHAALGQFLNYRLAMELDSVQRDLYLAIPAIAYQTFFQREFAQASLEKHQIQFFVYEPSQEIILQWKN
jgi:XisH protein